MIERLAIDTNAAIEWLAPQVPDPPPLVTATTIVVPLPVIGELYTGAFGSRRIRENVDAVTVFVSRYGTIKPDDDTARTYGELRARLHLTGIRASKMNDLWIAALCIQHALPLLTNDRGFDSIEGLTVIHW